MAIRKIQPLSCARHRRSHRPGRHRAVGPGVPAPPGNGIAAPNKVQFVEDGFELSEASSTPIMLQVRIGSCHVHRRFINPHYVLGAMGCAVVRPDLVFNCRSVIDLS